MDRSPQRSPLSPLARVLKAQYQLRSAIHLLEQARDAAPTHPLATSLAVAAHDAASTERGLDLVAFALRDIADPTRGCGDGPTRGVR